jgi:peptide/nickel transport system substrate-binding protein
MGNCAVKRIWLATLMLAALGTASAAAPVTINIAIGSEPSSLDPQLVQDGAERWVNDNTYDTLMVRNAAGVLAPGLAAEMPKPIDPTTWQFKLRPGIKFHDGEPLNADTVVHSVKRILDPNFKSRQLSWVNTLVQAEKVDDLTVNVKTKGPDPVLPSRMYWMKIVPIEASKNSNFAARSVGSGPYKFVEWVRGQRIVLELNPNYWGPKPEVERIVYRFVPEPGTRLAGLKSGDFDLITQLLPEYQKEVPQLASTSGPEVGVFVPNLRDPNNVVADIRVRRAMQLAIDRDAIAKELFQGFAEPTHNQLVGKGWFGFKESIKPYAYDPKEARRLLQEAGAIGKTVEVVTVSGRWLKDREQVEAISGFWEAVGLKVNVRLLEWKEYLDRIFDQKNRPQLLFALHGNPLFDADRSYTTYLKSGGESGSISSVARPDLDKMIDEARTELDLAKRQAIYEGIAQAVSDDLIYIFLMQAQDIYGLSKRMEWQPRTDGKLIIMDMRVRKS